jgi:taurine dioxygenase
MATAAVNVVPTGAALGADISGVDIRTMDDAAFAVIKQAWLDHLVLRVRGQAVDDPTHMAFAKRFGPLEFSPKTMFTGKPWLEDFPEMSQITNIKENGKPIGSLGNSDCYWHTDMSYIEEPPAGSLLHAIQVPPAGGDTHFLNMYRALDEMPAELRRAIDGQSIKHESVHSSDGSIRSGMKAPESDDVSTYPGTVHPIVRTHPETGRPALYLGRRINSYVMGMPVDESEDLLDALWAAADRPELAWTHEWEPGDIVVWDNRSAMHKRDGFDDNHVRLMHRTVLKGDRPY